MSVTDAVGPPWRPARRVRNFLDLPIETQKEIFGLCSQSDLICLSLVSQHFRDLAAAQLYRNFHIIFPDEDDPAFDSPVDGLAGGLDTFVTSDYNYAQHLRDLSLDTLSSGDKAEIAYKPYLYNVSCGKFMNTLLLLTLRKALALETFRWNIRVEISRPVYRALHQIQSLSHLHIRLQAGPSLYETPPPLPSSHLHSSIIPSTHVQELAPLPPPPPLPTFTNSAPLFYIDTDSLGPSPSLASKTTAKHRASKKSSLTKEPSTLSGFKKLKTLSVLDIDSLDVVTEIKSCVRNSSGTLTKLQLSFSDALGMQARKPPPTIDPDDSDPEDEFQVVPISNSGPYHEDSSEPARAFRAQEERKNQESILGRIFDVEPFVVRNNVQRKTREKEKKTKVEPTSNPGQDFIGALKTVATKLMKDLHGSGDFSASQQEILDNIANAASIYVANAANSVTAKTTEQNGESSNTSGSEPAEGKSDSGATEKEPEEPGMSLFKTKPAKPRDIQRDISPDDINIEEPEGELMMESQESSGDKAADDPQSFVVDNADPQASSSKAAPITENGAAPTSKVGKAMANLAAQKVNFKTLAEKLDHFETQANDLNEEIEGLRSDDGSLALERLAVAEKQMKNFSQNIDEIRAEMNTFAAEIDDAERQIPLALNADEEEAQNQRMNDYIRATRGLALRSLSIYLIPVKPSVLSRAIDLRALHRLTLLNVGPQSGVWSILHKENKESPLPLRKIFTDNVSASLLAFVHDLEELHEFFILERDNKYKPESFAPKTTVTIDQIRRKVLKKHLSTLKRLMVKNMMGTAWDFDEKTIMLVCRRGRGLEELACSMAIRDIHTFMQNISGLVSLRALHILQMRNDDTCVWVLRETRRFLVDNVSHHPHMKLEWISVDEEKVERIIRPAVGAPKKERKSKKSKGKQKAKFNGNELFPVMPTNWDMSSESDDDDDYLAEPRLETLEGIHFYDTWGVRIFKKEVLTGRI